jgi:hypothetical protein
MNDLLNGADNSCFAHKPFFRFEHDFFCFPDQACHGFTFFVFYFFTDNQEYFFQTVHMFAGSVQVIYECSLQAIRTGFFDHVRDNP